MFLLTHVSLRCKLFSFLCVLIGATLLESFAYNGFCAHSLNISLSYFFNFFFCALHSVECNNSRVWIKEWSLRINYRTLSCFTISSTKCIWMIIVLTCFLIPVSIGAKWKKKLNQIQQKFGKFLGISEPKIEISLKLCCVVHYCLIVDTCVQFQSLGSDFRD